MALNGSVTPALPPATFFSGRTLNNGVALPVTVAKNATLTFPVVGILDFSGYNTLSLLATVSAIPAGNHFVVTLVTIDPETGAAVVSNLGDLELVDETAADDYATTVYLPTYYATLSALVLPFYQHRVLIANTGATAGNLSVDAFKLWLTNA